MKIAPIVPHSTEFTEWKGINNPGPGMYDSASAFSQSTRLRGKSSLSTEDLVVRPSTSVPSIPRRNQSYGYLPGQTRQELLRQSAPDGDKRMSGMPGDTVGPDRYSPNVAVVQQNRSVRRVCVAVCLAVWLSGCLAVWLSGCLAVWLSGCAAVWLCGSVAVRLCGSVALWLCGSVALWLCGSVALWLCGCACMLLFPGSACGAHSDVCRAM
jgi:hypothetical protein